MISYTKNIIFIYKNECFMFMFNVILFFRSWNYNNKIIMIIKQKRKYNEAI